MKTMNSKLIHFTDLSGNDRYMLAIDNGTEIRQQEINRHEYEELKAAETIHYRNEIVRLKEKYRLFEKERIGK